MTEVYTFAIICTYAFKYPDRKSPLPFLKAKPK